MPDRRAALDLMRIAVVLGLIFFHAALVFDTRDDFYVKNDRTTEATTIVAGLAVVWAMPLLFLIAGIGARHSLSRRGRLRFATERLLRLGVLLVFATLTIVPVPQWLRHGAAEPYWRFWLRFFDVRFSPADFPFVLRGEYFETGHLWFIVLLLTFSLILAAVARVPPARLTRPGLALALAAVPLSAICAVVGLEEGLAGWSRWAYLLFFLYGYTIASDEQLGEAIRRHARRAGVIALVAFGASAPGFMTAEDPFTDPTPLAVVTRALFGVAGWCAVIAIVGLLDRPATAPAGHPRLFAYLAFAALPIYVLHQPIVVAVAYVVVPWDWPAAAKYAAIVAASLVLTFAAYDVLVRRTRATRFLFGMRGGSGVRP